MPLRNATTPFLRRRIANDRRVVCELADSQFSTDRAARASGRPPPEMTARSSSIATGPDEARSTTAP
ncbi:MAG TPA: hypothetical protein DCQ98_06440 [Planctomycetaceae bacterium]|nr:hypothetical protein [Planctomycetaceae bacterium]